MHLDFGAFQTSLNSCTLFLLNIKILQSPSDAQLLSHRKQTGSGRRAQKLGAIYKKLTPESTEGVEIFKIEDFWVNLENFLIDTMFKHGFILIIKFIKSKKNIKYV